MSELLLDRAGRRRSPATMPGFHAGHAPRNKGLRYPADPPKVEEIIAVMRTSGDAAHGRRLRGLIVMMWRAGLRIQEALALTEGDLDSRRGGAGPPRQGRARCEVGMDAWGWEQLEPWLDVRRTLPVGPLLCVINGGTRGRHWSPAAARAELRRTAAAAGVRRRFAPHQLRHAHAVEMAREGVPLIVIQRHLGPSNLGITSVYLQGIDSGEIIETVHARRAPMLPASASLHSDRGHAQALLVAQTDSPLGPRPLLHETADVANASQQNPSTGRLRPGTQVMSDAVRFENLEITNFRGISRLSLTELRDLVVIAGPNGCGKSAALDAVRLLKSVYGGYETDEWKGWFGEFQIDMAQMRDLSRLLRRDTEPAVIKASISLHPDEQAFLRDHGPEVAERLAWSEVLGRDRTAPARLRLNVAAAEVATHGPRVEELVAQTLEALRIVNTQTQFELALTITPGRPLSIDGCPAMNIIFRIYEPGKLGVVDFHSASRTYSRESLSGVQLDVSQFEQRRQQHLLYNWQGKYQNVKSELAGQYIRGLLARAAGSDQDFSDLNSTLTELFTTFFPDKTYSGPQPLSDGTLAFPVTLIDGSTHDIDELSLGEKEILYGYLRLRDTAPRYSVILLDEPELHLNPGLLQGLPDFYHERVGRAHSNQIWMVTHSDTLLRQAVQNQEISVFHMRTATSLPSDVEQAQLVGAASDVEQAVIDLVGDLASYKPRDPVVILESAGDAAFDVQMVSRLFPRLSQRLNFVAGGSRRRVHDLYSLLEKVGPELGQRFYAVVDRDWSGAPGSAPAVRTWDRYHIENYLLEPDYVLQGLRALGVATSLEGPAEVEAALRHCAAQCLPRLIADRLRAHVNRELVTSIDPGSDPTKDPAAALAPAISASSERLANRASNLLAPGELTRMAEAYRRELEVTMESDEWCSTVPGRTILRRFVGEFGEGVRYEHLRNVVLDKMVAADFEPPGMALALDEMLTGADAESR